MTSPLPLPPDAVDLLLSAKLDGNLDAAAHDLGLAPDDARARLEATPGVDARRQAFVAARDASRLGDGLPDAVRDRVVALALEESPAPAAAAPVVDDLAARRATRRASPWTTRLVGAGAVAATLLLVVGLVAVLGGDDDGSGDLAATEATGALQRYGDVSDEARLRALLAPTEEAPADGAADEGVTDAEGGTARPQTSDDVAFDAVDPSRLDECTASLSAELASGAPALARGVATYEGAPAGVVVFELDGRRFAVVFDPSTCVPRKTLLGPP